MIQVYAGHKGSKSNHTPRRRSKICNRQPPNRWSTEENDKENVSSSAKKLKMSSSSSEADVDSSLSYRILNFVTVFTMISDNVVCKTCKSNVTFTEEVMKCENCKQTDIHSSPFINCAYDINYRIVLAMRLLGIGLHRMMKFCGIMDLPRPVFQSYYGSIVKKTAMAVKKTYFSIFR